MYNEIDLFTLAKLLNNAIENNDNQLLINRYAYEITTRMYIPFNGEKTFEEMLTEYGYKPIEKINIKKL